MLNKGLESMTSKHNSSTLTHEDLKLGNARAIYKKQNHLTPSAIKYNKNLTWKKWWEKKYNDSYERYVNEKKAALQKDKH